MFELSIGSDMICLCVFLYSKGPHQTASCCLRVITWSATRIKFSSWWEGWPSSALCSHLLRTKSSDCIALYWLVHGHRTPLHIEQWPIHTLGPRLPATTFSHMSTSSPTVLLNAASGLQPSLRTRWSTALTCTMFQRVPLLSTWSQCPVLPVSRPQGSLCPAPWMQPARQQPPTRMVRHAMRCSPCHSPAKGPAVTVCHVSSMKNVPRLHITKQRLRRTVLCCHLSL